MILKKADRPVKPSGFSQFVNVEFLFHQKFFSGFVCRNDKSRAVQNHTFMPVILVFGFSKSGNKAFERNFPRLEEVF